MEEAGKGKPKSDLMLSLEQEKAELLKQQQEEDKLIKKREEKDKASAVAQEQLEAQTKLNEVMMDAESIIEGNKSEQEKLNEQILIFEEALLIVTGKLRLPYLFLPFF